ncbi:DNA-directed RNA polymerase III subunit RPC10 [Selaginella moellendorffii]|nr:DNA-directed RNA polymerase III subunit RPC10 [Selaginella moellendorffii]|eukprot:XP_002966136.2 DNA-directed RNA polymerase III subunit RPC10 [Selaginella moellendorffii]
MEAGRSTSKSQSKKSKKKTAEMEFCPTCSSLLLVEHAARLRYFCPTCAYIYNIDHEITKRIPLKNKEMDDILGSEDAWKNCDRTPITCAKCNHEHAYFMLVQIRSADEPSTAFYRCCNPDCSYRWRED